MNKKMLSAVCALSCAAAMAIGFTACDNSNNNNNNNDSGMSAADAATKIATFTTTPNTVNATFKQDVEIKVNNDSYKMFEQDFDDTVTVNIDYTAGNLYYYGKVVDKNNKTTEQLVVKEDNTYYYLTTYSVRKALTDEAAAKAKIGELLKSLAYRVSGGVDADMFVYSSDWIHDYVLLGSGNVTGTEKNHFTYKYEEAENDGLKVSLDSKYAVFIGDGGKGSPFECGTDASHTGSKVEIETDSKGYITSFNQTVNNHGEMPITTPAVPLDYTGTRSLTATYNGTITKKTASDISQTLENPTVTFSNPNNATVAVTDMVLEGQKPTSMTPVTSGGSVAIGHWIAVKVNCEEGYEVEKVTVGGHETVYMAEQYCYHVTEDDYNAELKIDVKVKSSSGVVAPATITVNNVEHATVKTFDLLYKSNTDMTFTESTTVAVGHFAAIQVTCENGYVVDKVMINGKEATLMGDYYLVFSAATAGQTINVVVTVKAAA